jgi:hypothetical protein
MRHPKWAICLAPLALLCQTAWSSVTSCTSATLDVLEGGSGCEQVDKVFSQFSNFDNGSSPPAPSSINVSFSGTSAAGPITDTYASSDPAWANPGTSNDIFLYNYTQVDQTVNPGYVLTGFDLNPASSSFTGSDSSVQIVVDICTNLDDNTCAFGASNFGQLNYVDSASGVTESYCYATCNTTSVSGSLSVSFDPSLNITSIFVTNWVIVDPGSGTVTFGGLSNDYFEGLGAAVPEPGPLGLLCAGLGGLVLLRRRAINNR